LFVPFYSFLQSDFFKASFVRIDNGFLSKTFVAILYLIFVRAGVFYMQISAYILISHKFFANILTNNGFGSISPFNAPEFIGHLQNDL